MVTLLLPILSKLCKTDVDLLKPQIWGKTTLFKKKRHRIDLLASVHTVLIFESMIWRGFWNSSSWPEKVTSGSNSWYMKLLANLSKSHFVESLRNSERKKIVQKLELENCFAIPSQWSRYVIYKLLK